MTDELIENAVPTTPEPEGPIVTPESRFLFVDVAAMRAKQLRRGALPRVEMPPEGQGPHQEALRKPERLAMEEVRQGLVRPLLPEKPPASR